MFYFLLLICCRYFICNFYFFIFFDFIVYFNIKKRALRANFLIYQNQLSKKHKYDNKLIWIDVCICARVCDRLNVFGLLKRFISTIECDVYDFDVNLMIRLMRIYQIDPLLPSPMTQQLSLFRYLTLFS